MQRFVVLACAAALLAACASRPDNVVEDFYRAVEAGEQDVAMSKLSPDLVGMLGDSKMRTVLTKQTEQIAACGGIDTIATKLDGDDAVQRGTVSITYGGNCEAKTQEVKLVKVNKEWKISADK